MDLSAHINLVLGSEREGRVIETDIKKHVKEKFSQKIMSQKNNLKNEFPHSDFGKIEIKDIPRIKQIAAKHLVNSWTTIPHVTNHDEADITEMENFRVSLKDIYTGERKKIHFTHLNHTNNLLRKSSFEFKNVIDNGFHIAKTEDCIFI